MSKLLTVSDLSKKCKDTYTVTGPDSGLFYVIFDQGDGDFTVCGDGADFPAKSLQGSVDLINNYLEPRYSKR